MGISSELATRAADVLVAFYTDEETAPDSADNVARILDEVLCTLAKDDPVLFPLIERYEAAMLANGGDPAPDVPPEDYDGEPEEHYYDSPAEELEAEYPPYDSPQGDLAYDAAREQAATEHRSRD